MISTPGGRGPVRLVALAGGLAAIVALVLVLSAVHVLPQLRNPFTQSTIDRSQPVVLKSITKLSRYEAADGTFQVVVDLTHRTRFIPSFLAGSETLFIGQGNVIAFVNFAGLKNSAVKVSPDRAAVSIRLPHAQLESAVLNVKQSYVFAQQQGFINRVGDFFSGNPNGQQQVYILAVNKINAAAQRSSLVPQAQRNTQDMLDSLLRSLGFQRIAVTFT